VARVTEIRGRGVVAIHIRGRSVAPGIEIGGGIRGSAAPGIEIGGRGATVGRRTGARGIVEIFRQVAIVVTRVRSGKLGLYVVVLVVGAGVLVAVVSVLVAVAGAHLVGLLGALRRLGRAGSGISGESNHQIGREKMAKLRGTGGHDLLQVGVLEAELLPQRRPPLGHARR
jgi:hypothetical protein